MQYIKISHILSKPNREKHKHHVLTDESYSNSFQMTTHYYFICPRKIIAKLNKNIL